MHRCLLKTLYLVSAGDNLLSRGFSVLEVSQKSGMSESSVYRRIRIIKVKVEKVRFL